MIDFDDNKQIMIIKLICVKMCMNKLQVMNIKVPKNINN